MFIYTMVLYAANPNKQFLFGEKEKRLFRETANACNNSTNFKAKGKMMEITEFQTNCLTVKLKSKSPIEKPTLTLRGFSRALIKTGEFTENIYRSSLFNARLIERENPDDEDIDDISVVQKVVALFMSNTNEEAKEKIRQIVTEL